VDGQRTKGFELGVTGSPTPAWTVIGGYAIQHGRVRQNLWATAKAGAMVAQVPEHAFSVWN
jgi:catecholate siderophore receptor